MEWGLFSGQLCENSSSFQTTLRAHLRHVTVLLLVLIVTRTPLQVDSYKH